VSGPAGTSIVNQADQCQADVIVMSTHGRNGLAHMLLGGVTEEVVRTAHSLILTLRPDAFQFELPQ
jgi:nucleotide-binding universal stress UspA family protein